MPLYKCFKKIFFFFFELNKSNNVDLTVYTFPFHCVGNNQYNISNSGHVWTLSYSVSIIQFDYTMIDKCDRNIIKSLLERQAATTVAKSFG